MGFDILQSRRTYFEKCMYWSRNEDDDPEHMDELIHNVAPTATFYAKEVQSETAQSSVYGGVFMIDKEFVVLETGDDIYGIKQNDLVLYQGEKWLVNSLQMRHARSRQNEFANDKNLSHIWTIQLRK